MTELQDGLYIEGGDDDVQAIVASAADTLLSPPREWFDDPKLEKVTPLTITADGQVYGHIAPWHATHIGMPGVTPPRSRYDYAFFKTGVVVCADGSDVAVGQLTLAGGHASIRAGAADAVKHYDDTASAVADLSVGEDSHGIWVAGALRPGVSSDQVRAIRASAPSGDWRPINGNHELVAVCQVNVPGFPVARALVAGGEMLGLVAAGAREMYSIRLQEQSQAIVAGLEDRLTKLEDRLASKEAVEEPEPVTASVEPIQGEVLGGPTGPHLHVSGPTPGITINVGTGTSQS